MKEVCNCSCQNDGTKSPWCSLLKKSKCDGSIVHFWYKLDWLRNEIRKRLAYLGSMQNYENVPDVYDLVGTENSSITPMALTLTYNIDDILAGIQTRLRYLGKTGNYESAPNIDDLNSAALVSTGLSENVEFVFTEATLKEEVQKRSAYLGKFRRTENTPHLLDLIAMTDDEEDLFAPFAKEAMADVWKEFSAPFAGVSKSAWWQETTSGTVLEGVHYQFNFYVTSSLKALDPLKKTLLEALTERIIWKWLVMCYPAEAASYDAIYQQAIAGVRKEANDLHALCSGQFSKYLPEAANDVWAWLSAPFVGLREKAWSSTASTLTFPLDVTYNMTSADLLPLKTSVQEALEERVIWKWLAQAYPPEATTFDTLYQQTLATIRKCCNSFKARWSEVFIPFARAAMADVYDALSYYAPKWESAYQFREGKETAVFTDTPSLPVPAVYFDEGQYVEYNGVLYIANAAGSSNDFAGKLVPTEDYRDSIHIGLRWECCQSKVNNVEPLDTGIFEALVARIIWKWLSRAYPSEAEIYLNEYNDELEKIKKRVRALDGTHIVSRVPRIL